MPEIGQVTFVPFGQGITPFAVLVQCESRDAKKLQTELGWRAGRSGDYSRDAWLSPIRVKFKLPRFSPRSAMFRSSFTLSAGRGRVAWCSLGKTRDTNMRLARMPDAVNPGTQTIGVDVGGTKVAAGFVDAQGEITQHTRTAMNPRGTAEEGLAAVTTAIDTLLKMAPEMYGGVQRIGICAPGPLDPQTGVVVNPPNVPCWRNFPLAAEISRRYGGFVRIDNDANAAGLAEALWGAGRGYKNVFYAGIGTGIGTGILFDRRIYYGRTGGAAGAGGWKHHGHHQRGCGTGLHGR